MVLMSTINGDITIFVFEQIQFEQSFDLAKALQQSGTLSWHMLHFGTNLSEHGHKMVLCCFIYGAIKE